jgi:chromosome segregation and condensation protein ScpB
MKTTITIGKRHGDGNLTVDVATLLKTRGLIQANSGGGKSWLLRRIAEQLFGIVPVIIIDPEGEFATLREKFGYVLVGKGGETPADSRSAKMVAHKLLELQASAVCDLYEMNPSARHHWVRVFLEALVDAPKELWHPTVIIVDEAHTFCPEKGQGESEASEAMTALATRGRKRRFCAIWATQRLAKLNKSATAELLNRLVGPTFEDVDLKRAADLLSIPADERRDFDKEMRTRQPGDFYAFGRALCTERTLVRVGDVQTSHEIEESQGLGPPPAPAKVRALLPQLADLPQQAEEKAKTEAELRNEIRRLNGELVLAKRTPPAAPAAKVERKEVLVLKDAQITRLHAAAERFEKMAGDVVAVVRGISEAILKISARPLPPQPAPMPARVAPAPSAAPTLPRIAQPRPAPRLPAGPAAANGELTKGERRILTAAAQYEEGVTRKQLSVLCDYKKSTRDEYVKQLAAKGYLARSGLELVATAEGRAALGDFEPLPTGQALIDYWLQRLPLGERKIFEIAIQAYPQAVQRTALDELTGYKKSTRDEYIKQSVARRILEVAGPGEIRAAKHFFE